jgi:hypothetical protein
MRDGWVKGIAAETGSRESRITEERRRRTRANGGGRSETKTELQIGKREDRIPKWDYIGPRCIDDFFKSFEQTERFARHDFMKM